MLHPYIKMHGLDNFKLSEHNSLWQSDSSLAGKELCAFIFIRKSINDVFKVFRDVTSCGLVSDLTPPQNFVRYVCPDNIPLLDNILSFLTHCTPSNHVCSPSSTNSSITNTPQPRDCTVCSSTAL